MPQVPLVRSLPIIGVRLVALIELYFRLLQRRVLRTVQTVAQYNTWNRRL
jgi:hypothetical protein